MEMNIEFYVIISIIMSFWVYLIQSAELFDGVRISVKCFLAKRMARSKCLWIWKFPNHWLHCPFCLSFWLSIPVAVYFSNLWLPMIIPVMVNIVNKLAF